MKDAKRNAFTLLDVMFESKELCVSPALMYGVGKTQIIKCYKPFLNVPLPYGKRGEKNDKNK